MNQEDLTFRKDGNVAYITIQREESLNALNGRILMKLDQIFSDLEYDDEILVVAITGAGPKAFVAGADIKEIKEAGDQRTELITKGQKIFSKIRNSSKVVIAAVNGFALGGGCELALACDIRIASENARFGFPEVKLGLMPGYGGTQLLPRLTGVGRAKYTILTGDILTAAEAFQFGLVEKVCPPERLMEETDTLAKKIAANGPFAVRTCKRAVSRGIELSLDEGLKLELEEYDRVAHSKDAEEGITAFLEKRRPSFEGK
jgi:enoyl-CoA hydratase